MNSDSKMHKSDNMYIVKKKKTTVASCPQLLLHYHRDKMPLHLQQFNLSTRQLKLQDHMKKKKYLLQQRTILNSSANTTRLQTDQLWIYAR